jgi:hypothetical protein
VAGKPAAVGTSIAVLPPVPFAILGPGSAVSSGVAALNSMRMKSTPLILSALAPLALLLPACTSREPQPPDANMATSSAATADSDIDRWIGQWNGPEGTFLRIAGGQGRYEITIRNLDGPSIYRGAAVGDHIEFERNGVKESLRPTNGADTGMKWLSEKLNCLTVRPGEGYCRG